MHIERGVPIWLNIPFYPQHWEFTCGPASLMMAMKYFDDYLCLGKDLEIDLWREGTMVEVYGTSRYGLAFSAAFRGFEARVTSNTAEIDYVSRVVPPPDNLNMKMLKDLFEERKTRCRRMGVRERRELITVKTIRNALLHRHVPIILTNTRGDDRVLIPHWVVVTGIDDRFTYFNDPQDVDPGLRIGLPSLQEFVWYRGEESMVEVWK